MYKVAVNYNYTPDWLGDDYLVYDRSDDGKDHISHLNNVIRRPNVGQVDYDKLDYLVQNYNELPDVFFWGKTNIFKYVDIESLGLALQSKVFTPLLKQTHRTYMDSNGAVNFYKDGVYYERNDSWYVVSLGSVIPTFHDFARRIGIESPEYIPFAPGGNYILTKEVVHKHPVGLYETMRDYLGYTTNPAEAHMCERAYYILFK